MRIFGPKHIDLINECKFATSRSGGAGGQHVNKVNTKVELRFSIESSEILTPEEKQILIQKLQTYITKKNELVLTADNSRTQLKNKDAVIDKFYLLINNALKIKKKRKKSKPSKQAIENRLKLKKMKAEKKARRNKNIF